MSGAARNSANPQRATTRRRLLDMMSGPGRHEAEWFEQENDGHQDVDAG